MLRNLILPAILAVAMRSCHELGLVAAARAERVSWHWCEYTPGYHSADWWKRCRGMTELPKGR